MRSVLVNFATALYTVDMPSCARPVYARCHLTQWLTGRPPRWVAYDLVLGSRSTYDQRWRTEFLAAAVERLPQPSDVPWSF